MWLGRETGHNKKPTGHNRDSTGLGNETIGHSTIETATTDLVVDVLRIEINSAQDSLAIDESRLCDAVRAVLSGEGIESGNVSVAIIDASTMHELNRRHLEHDYPTDVLSFLLERDGNTLEGEVIASADEAILNAPRFGWSPESELMLYVIHGALHLCGYDDLEPALAAVMHARQEYWMETLGQAVFAEKQP